MGVKETVASLWNEWVGMNPRQLLSQGVNLGTSETCDPHNSYICYKYSVLFVPRCSFILLFNHTKIATLI